MSDFPANDADELEIKKRARRRFVGAAALALLAAILLLLAMESEAPPATPDIQVSIPPHADAPPSAAEGTDGKPDIEPDTDASAPEPVALTPGPTATVLNNAAPKTQSVSSEPPPQPVTPLARPKPVPEPAREPVRESEKPAVKPAAKPGAGFDPVLALLGKGGGESSRPAAMNASGGKGSVYVQIGAFSDAGRADALVDELKKQGFAAYAEQAGKVNRVRIGPLSKKEGERTAARLKAKGRKALIVSR